MAPGQDETETKGKGAVEMTAPPHPNSPAYTVQSPAVAPTFYTENAGNVVSFGSGGMVGHPPNVAAAGVPIVQHPSIVQQPPVVQQTVNVVPNAPPTQVVQNVTVIHEEACCNVYWVLFVLGLLLFPPLFICGSFGTCSSRHHEKMGGIANAIALGVWVVIIIAIAASA